MALTTALQERMCISAALFIASCAVGFFLLKRASHLSDALLKAVCWCQVKILSLVSCRCGYLLWRSQLSFEEALHMRCLSGLSAPKEVETEE